MIETSNSYSLQNAGSIPLPRGESIQLQTAAALYISLRVKHSPAAAHSLRVGMYATAWGYTYGLSETHRHLFEFTGLMHEIGKIGIPDRILQKPESLSEQERAMMALQPQVAVEILKASGASRLLLDAVGLVGKDFSVLPDPQATDSWAMAARLIRVIDAYDSMTSRSPYRDPKSTDEAIRELVRNSNSQFDPKLTRSFAQMVLRPDSSIEERVQSHWSHIITPCAKKFQFCFDAQAMQDSSVDPLLSVNNMADTFYRHMLHNLQQGLIFVDSDFRILQWNKATAQLTGRPANLVLHQYWSPTMIRFCDQDGNPLREEDCPFLGMLKTGERSLQKMKIRRPDNSLVDVKVEIIPFTNDRSKMTGTAIILYDISEQRVLEQTIIHLNESVSLDELTKVANRRELNRQLTEFIRNHSDGVPPGAILICDIDYFKRINDHFSHQAGDEALKTFASVLRESCRSTDLVARYGGEEFVMLCPRCDLKEAEDLAETLRRKIARTSISALRGACITASFGVTVVKRGDTEESAMARADRGLLMAKENGRDCVFSVTEDLEVPESIEPSGTVGWPENVAPDAKQVRIRTELVSFVPKTLIFEKLLGFAKDYAAKITDTQAQIIVFEIDSRILPNPNDPKEKPNRHQVQVGIREIELRCKSSKDKTRHASLLRVVISPLSVRDRRDEVYLNQCNRVLCALQAYLLAEPFTDALKVDLIRTFKPMTNDSRY
jgi:diguanylate cyclase (GGDEF)-like protein/PAS domain S-box-containing protein